MQQQEDPPTLPVLSPSLLTTFGSLRGGAERRLFKRLYLAVWRYLWPINSLDVVSQGYPLPGTLGSLQPQLRLSQWYLLSKLWILSGGGAVAVDSRDHSFSGTERNLIANLIDHRFLIRTSFDPLHPYAVKPQHIVKTYISFTPAGVRFYGVVVKECNKRLMNDLYPSNFGRK